MQDKLPRYTIRIERVLLNKILYIAEFYGRTTNKQLEQLVKKCILEFEKEHGEIKQTDLNELKENL